MLQNARKSKCGFTIFSSFDALFAYILVVYPCFYISITACITSTIDGNNSKASFICNSCSINYSAGYFNSQKCCLYLFISLFLNILNILLINLIRKEMLILNYKDKL